MVAIKHFTVNNILMSHWQNSMLFYNIITQRDKTLQMLLISISIITISLEACKYISLKLYQAYMAHESNIVYIM